MFTVNKVSQETVGQHLVKTLGYSKMERHWFLPINANSGHLHKSQLCYTVVHYTPHPYFLSVYKGHTTSCFGHTPRSAVSSNMDVTPHILGLKKGDISSMRQVSLQNVELNPTPHWNFFCSDMWYKNNNNEMTICGQAGTSIISEMDRPGCTQTDFWSKPSINPKHRPNATLNPLLPLRDFSQRGRRAGARGFLPLWYFLDRGFYLTAVPVG